MDRNKVNDDLQKFWDLAIALPEDYKQELLEAKDLDYRNFAPNEKFAIAASELGDCQNVLDYGCGSGWASLIIAKSGKAQVKAVDLGVKIIDSAKFFARIFDLEGKMNPEVIDQDWLKKVPDNSHDGFFSSNVFDVIPLETTKEILKEVNRILTKDAKIIIGLNYYISLDNAKKANIELKEDKYLFMNGILRLTSLSDQEWIDLFEPYFRVEKLEYFAWPGEPEARRRLFRLRKK